MQRYIKIESCQINFLKKTAKNAKLQLVSVVECPFGRYIDQYALFDVLK
jgi:hypothetical protein